MMLSSSLKRGFVRVRVVVTLSSLGSPQVARASPLLQRTPPRMSAWPHPGHTSLRFGSVECCCTLGSHRPLPPRDGPPFPVLPTSDGALGSRSWSVVRCRRACLSCSTHSLVVTAGMPMSWVSSGSHGTCPFAGS